MYAESGSPLVTCGRSVVVAAATNSVSRPSHEHHQQTDDQQDDPDHHANMGEGEGRDEGRQEEPEDDKDDSENDHDDYLVSMFDGHARCAGIRPVRSRVSVVGRAAGVSV